MSRAELRAQVLRQIRWGVQRTLRPAPRQVTLALGLVLACALQYGLAIVPAQRQLDQARRLAARPLPAAASTESGSPAALQLVRLYARFEAEDSFPAALAQLLGSAQLCGLALDEGAYKVSRENAGQLVRYQIALPLRGAYPQIRRFLDALARELPSAALEDVRFERQRIDEPLLDAKVRIVLFLRGRR